VQWQAFHHVSNGPDGLKVSHVDEEKQAESRGATGSSGSSLEALKVHAFIEKPIACAL
jgi:hypothetical protein